MTPPVGMNEYATPAEVAKSLAVSTRTVTRMCAEGTIPAVRVGRMWRIKRQEFAKWLRAQRNGRWLHSISADQFGGSDFNGKARKSGGQLAQLLKMKPEDILKLSKQNTGRSVSAGGRK